MEDLSDSSQRDFVWARSALPCGGLQLKRDLHISDKTCEVEKLDFV